MADVITRLKVESTEYDSKIKRASQGLLQMEQACRKVGGTLAVLEKDELEFVKGLGKMETVSKDARGQISELTKAFTDLSLQYKRLTDEEKQGDFGKALSSSLDQLKTRIQDTKKDLADINQELSGSKFGQFGGLIDSVGQKMGINANLTELLTSKTALMTAGIGAGIAIIGQAADAWARYNQELSRQDQVTTVTTGLKGPEANAMTDAARSIADTYGVDFREVINAANTLMTQFGQSGSQALQLIRDGMQGMIMGDGPKLLSMIQQYAPSFRDAGISASQLVAIIHNSEGGIFTDQNMNAIVMGIKNIRLMTNQTSEALAKMGIDGADMTRKLNDGTMTIFEALGQVSNAIERTGSGSQAAGEVMQYVFGRQGAVAGTKLGEAIATLNTNLNETKRQTGELGAAYADLELANERLNSAIRDCFEYDGWEQMTTGIKTGLLNALSEVLEVSIKIKNSWVGELGATIFDGLSSAALETMGIFGRLLNLIRGIKSEAGDISVPDTAGQEGGLTGKVPERIKRPSGEASALKNTTVGKREEAHKQNLDRYDKQIAEQQWVVDENRRKFGESTLVPAIQQIIDDEKKKLQKLQAMRQSYVQQAEAILKPKPTLDTNGPGTNKTPSTPKTEAQQNEAAIAKLTEEYQNLATAAKTADDAQKAGLSERMTAIRGEIRTLQERNAELKKFADEAKGVKVEVAAQGSLPQLTQQLKELQQAQADALTGTVWQQYQQQIEQASLQIDALKGKWKAGEVATFTIKTDDSELIQKLQDIANVTIADKTLTVTADTVEAYSKVQELVSDIEGREVSIEVKPQEKPLPTLDDYRIQAMIAIDTQNTKVDTNTLQTLLKDAIEKGIDTTSLNLEPIAEQIGKGVNVPDSVWEGIFEGYEGLCDAIGAKPIKIDLKTGNKAEDEVKNIKADWKDAAKDVQSLGSALQSIEDPAAKVMGIVAQAIATVALTFSKSLAGTVTPWDWIAAAAAGTATMISTITAIKSATKGGFAEGGIVPGNSFSGDNLRLSDYGVNSGELILNRAQQNNIADQLRERDSGGSMSGGLPYVTGEKIVLGINNWGRSKGYGQLVFSNR